MKLIALDPASNKFGVSWFVDGKLVATQTLQASGSDPLKRRLEMAYQLQDILTQADRVASEEPNLLGRNNSGNQRLLGMIELITKGNVSFIHPMSLKKSMGAGTLDKLEVALAAGERLKTEEEKEMMADIISREAFDESDAIAVGLSFLEGQK